jgi:hypothetical protein
MPFPFAKLPNLGFISDSLGTKRHEKGADSLGAQNPSNLYDDLTYSRK